MKNLRGLSINRKLTLILMAASFLTVLIASTAIGLFDWFEYRAENKRELTMLAHLIGINSAPAIKKNTPREAHQSLQALRIDKRIVAACLHGEDGSEIASFRRGDVQTPCPAHLDLKKHPIRNGLTILSTKIRYQGKEIGQIYLQSDTHRLYTRLFWILSVLIIVILLSTLFSLLVSSQLKKLIATPLNHLFITARKVAKTKDYSLRAPQTTWDEIGQFVQSFNDMLNNIQERDSALLRYKENLERLSHQNELLLYSTGGAIFGLDDKGIITFVNPGAIKIFGRPIMKSVGQPLLDMIPHIKPNGELCVRDKCPIQKTLQDGTHHHVSDKLVITSDGRRVPVDYISNPIKEKGRLRGAVVVFKDMTLQKKTTRELQIAKEAAEINMRAKGEFLANMSHEIRTPIYTINGMTELLLASSLDTHQKDYIEGIHHAGNMLLDIINDILDLSKIEAGKLVLHEEEFNLLHLVESCVEVVAPRAEEKNVSLALAIDPTLPRQLVGDPIRTRQVLMNFLGNSIKFTDHGEILVKAEKGKETARHLKIKFFVVDSGIGISATDQEKIFAPFSQADPTNSHKHGGTGLGLAISKRLVELMQGDIGLESQPGKGSTFWCEIQFNRKSPAPDPVIAPHSPFTGTRTLIIDPHPAARSILAERLRYMGLSTEEADDRRHAMETLHRALFESNPIQIVFFATSSGKMEATDFICQVRGNIQLTATDFIIMTPLSQSSAYEDLYPKSGIVHLKQPLTQAHLMEALTQATLKDLKRASPSPSPSSSTTQIKRAKNKSSLLVVEDNQLNQKVTVLLLNRLGYQADAASTGEEALDKLRHHFYDLVLLDCQMPDIDGYSVASEFRKKENKNHPIPILAMTAHTADEERRKCLASGMNDFLSKPIKPEELKSALDRWLDPKKAKKTA